MSYAGSVQGICSASEETARLKGDSLQAGGETPAGGDGQDEGVLGGNSQCEQNNLSIIAYHNSMIITESS